MSNTSASRDIWGILELSEQVLHFPESSSNQPLSQSSNDGAFEKALFVTHEDIFNFFANEDIFDYT